VNGKNIVVHSTINQFGGPIQCTWTYSFMLLLALYHLLLTPYVHDSEINHFLLAGLGSQEFSTLEYLKVGID